MLEQMLSGDSILIVETSGVSVLAPSYSVLTTISFRLSLPQLKQTERPERIESQFDLLQ